MFWMFISLITMFLMPIGVAYIFCAAEKDAMIASLEIQKQERYNKILEK